MTSEPDTAAKEYLVSIAGPLVSLTLGGIGLVLLDVTEGPVSAVLFGYLAFINILLGLFNLLPGFRSTAAGSSGPRSGTCTATERVRPGSPRERVSASPSSSAGWARSRWSAATALPSSRSSSRSSSSTEPRSPWPRRRWPTRLPSVDVRSLARPVLPVTADLPLAEALRRAAAASLRILVVDATGAPTAVLSTDAVDAVPAERRPWVSVGSVSRRLVKGLVLDARLEGEAVLAALRSTPASEYLVVDDDGDVVGVLATRDVVRRLAPQS